MSLRSRVRLALHNIGLERIRTPSFVDLIHHEGISTVLDVGANVGQYAKELRLFGYKGRIVSFEPMSAAYHGLASAAHGNWEARHMALGAVDGHDELNISEASVFNSFKPLTEYTRVSLPGARQDRKEQVVVRRLDTLIAEEPDLARDAYLKIDTQGFELEVLEGAGDSLALFRAVQLELPLQALYEKQSLLTEMIIYMRERGFSLVMAKENGFDRRQMRLLELDAVFVPADGAHIAASQDGRKSTGAKVR